MKTKTTVIALGAVIASLALALAASFRTEHVLAATLVAGAMASDAISGSDTPFDKRIQSVRGHGGQIAVAGVLRNLMKGSQIRAAHVACDRVQDPYSIRCQPQVAGACLGVLRHVCKVVETEANAVTDNPLVFADSRAVLSGGNFHAEPVALAKTAPFDVSRSTSPGSASSGEVSSSLTVSSSPLSGRGTSASSAGGGVSSAGAVPAAGASSGASAGRGSLAWSGTVNASRMSASINLFIICVIQHFFLRGGHTSSVD